jgi:hypothetical protein
MLRAEQDSSRLKELDMNRIRTALKIYADRYLEAMAYADPAGLAYYALDPVPDGADGHRSGDAVSVRELDTARRRQPTAVAA